MWVRDPHEGGKKIPPLVKKRTEARIRRHAEKHFTGRYRRLDVRFRAQFCYIDAYTEPHVSPKRLPKNFPETRDGYIERRRNTPTRLCRLRYFSEECWSLAIFIYSHEIYEPCFYPKEFYGNPEEAFHLAAQLCHSD